MSITHAGEVAWTNAMSSEDMAGPLTGGNRDKNVVLNASTTALATDFYTVAQVATKTSFSAYTIRRAIASGRLVAHKFGHEFRIKTSDYERWTSGAMHAPTAWAASPLQVAATTTTDYRW